MKIQFWKPAISSGSVKATIHRNGNLGLSHAASQLLNIKENTYVKIGRNVEDSRDQNLYLQIAHETDENALKVNKAGNYYYLNTKAMFNELKIDYVKKKIIYDILEFEYDNENIYKLIKREIERKKK